MRGRLIYPFLVDFRRLDTTATAADPDGGGPLLSGYDADFREPQVLDVASVRTPARKEHPSVMVSCQIESPTMEAIQMLSSGHSPTSNIIVVAHFSHLEYLGLVDPDTGRALIHVNDRVAGIYDKWGNLIQEIRTPPGLYVMQSKPASYGLGESRNLLVITLEERAQGSQTG